MGVKNENNITVSVADLEPYFSNELLGEKKIEGLDTRCSIHIHSCRYRLADPDGISAKAVIDGLVKVGIFADDTTKQIKEVTFSQEKIGKEKTEMTIIDIKTT